MRAIGASLGLIGVLAMPSPVALAQEAPTTLGALLSEVRLLRQALERQSALQARAQLVIGRLALQDQRLARARSELQRAEAGIAELSGERTRMQSAVEELGRAADQAGATGLPDIEREQRMIAVRLKELETQVAAAEARRLKAAQTVAAEESRYEEIERWFDDLDRELNRLAR